MFEIRSDTRILDLGSEDGSNIKMVLDGTPIDPANVWIADIDPQAVDHGRRAYGFRGVVIDESGKLPFDDGFFDIVYCSSVIEHVTLPKSEVWSIASGEEFRARAIQAQTRFAREIERVGRQYFVQTPASSFPIESHTWLPLLGHLPRNAMLPVMRVTNKYWIKGADPDFNLLSADEMKSLFPRATIIRERFLGMTKSIMAVHSHRVGGGR
ncbi:MAG: class I SAM-dependent methyltransferase [Pyrinomonadaceae bacterium]